MGNPPSPNPAGKLHVMLGIQSIAHGVHGPNGMAVLRHVEGGQRSGQDLLSSQPRMMDHPAVGNPPSPNPVGKLHAIMVIPLIAYGVPGANGALVQIFIV